MRAVSSGSGSTASGNGKVIQTAVHSVAGDVQIVGLNAEVRASSHASSQGVSTSVLGVSTSAHTLDDGAVGITVRAALTCSGCGVRAVNSCCSSVSAGRSSVVTAASHSVTG